MPIWLAITATLLVALLIYPNISNGVVGGKFDGAFGGAFGGALNGEAASSPGGTPGFPTPESFIVAEMLFHPIWDGANGAGVTVSAIPSDSFNLRLRVGTVSGVYTDTITDCYKGRLLLADVPDTDGTCDVINDQRVDFVLHSSESHGVGLATDTRYYYRLEVETPVGSGTWSPRPEASFLTLCGNGPCNQRYAVINDEHILNSTVQSNCGDPADPEYLDWLRQIQTVQNIRNLNGTRNYRGYIGTGDFAMTLTGSLGYKACAGVQGRSPGGCGPSGTVVCGPGIINSCFTQDQCDVRYLVALQKIWPVIRDLPHVLALGNHDFESEYMEDHGVVYPDDISNLKQETWYIDDTHNLKFFSRNARLKYMPSANFTYGRRGGISAPEGAGDAAGTYFSFASGSAEILVRCSQCGLVPDLDGDLTPYEFPDDFPGYVDGWNDWKPSDEECTFMTGAADCSGTSGRFRDTTWDANSDGDNNELTTTGDVVTITKKLSFQHHNAGSSTSVGGGGGLGIFYGRGGLTAVERFCTGDGTTQCSIDLDCAAIPPSTCAAYTGAEPMAGFQSDLQREAKAFSAVANGNSFGFFNGHDHISLAGMKFDSGGATNVYYVTGTQPSDDQSGPNWTDSFDYQPLAQWGGLTNDRTGVDPDFCTPDSFKAITVNADNLTACNAGDMTSPGSFGSLLRGYLDVEIDFDDKVTVSQVATVLPQDSIYSFSTNNLDDAWVMEIDTTTITPPSTTAPDLGSLTIPASRVCYDPDNDGDCDGFKWFDIPEPNTTGGLDTSGWAVVDATTCGTPFDPADTPQDDTGAIESCISAAGTTGTIIDIPAGTWNVTNGNTGITLTKNNIWLRGVGAGSTIIDFSDITIPNDFPNCSTGQAFICTNGSITGAVTWNNGLGLGDVDYNVAAGHSFAVGDWAYREQTNTCPELTDEKVLGGDHFAQIDRVTNVTGNTITVDRGNRMDYGADSCFGETIAELNPVENFGFTGFTVQWPPVTGTDGTWTSYNQGCTNLNQYSANSSFAGCKYQNNPIISINEAVGAFILDNVFDGSVNMQLGFEQSARSLARRNVFKNVDNIAFNSSTVLFVSGATDNVVDHNIFENVAVGLKSENGNSGNVFAYNYSADIREKCAMVHGSYVRDALFEGNYCDTFHVDRQWSRNGPGITVHCNRWESDGSPGVASTQRGMITLHDGSVSCEVPVADKNSAWIANWAGKISGGQNFPFAFAGGGVSPGLNSNCSGSTPAEFVPNAYLEFNRSTATTWGTCASCTFENNDTGASPPAGNLPTGWDDASIPHSFYASTTKPTFWCTEACVWDPNNDTDNKDSMGALGDQSCDTYSKIIYDGTTCTP